MNSNINLYHTINGRHGKITCFKNKENSILMVKAQGYISYKMICEDLNLAKSFSEKPYTYYADLTHFVLPNPLNVLILRQFSSIPNIKSYNLIIDNPLQKGVFKILQPLVKFSKILNSDAFLARL